MADTNINIGPCSISKKLIPAKLIYMSAFAVVASTVPYGTAFLVSVGLSVTQAGMVMGFRTIPALFTTPLFGALADYTGQHKLVIVVLGTLSAAMTAPQPWIAQALSTGKIKNLTTSLNSTTELSAMHPDNRDNKPMFYVLFFVLILMGVFGMPMVSFIDSAVMNIVKGCKNASYGQQRVFAPIGFALGSFFSGFIADNYNDPVMSKYTGVYCVAGATWFITIVLLCCLDQRRSAADQIEKHQEAVKLQNTDKENEVEELVIEEPARNDGQKKNNTLKKLFKVCCNIRVSFFLLIVSHMGINFFLVNAYMTLLMDDLGSTKTIVGLANTMSSVFELFAFPLTSSFIKLVGGRYPCFYIATASYSVRFLLMSFIENPWLFLPVQFFQSFGYAVFWVAVNEHTYAISTKAISASIFTLVWAVYMPFGGFISNVVGGVIYENYGGRVLFRIASANSAVMTILVIIFYFKYEKRFELETCGDDKAALELTEHA